MSLPLYSICQQRGGGPCLLGCNMASPVVERAADSTGW